MNAIVAAIVRSDPENAGQGVTSNGCTTAWPAK